MNNFLSPQNGVRNIQPGNPDWGIWLSSCILHTSAIKINLSNSLRLNSSGPWRRRVKKKSSRSLWLSLSLYLRILPPPPAWPSIKFMPAVLWLWWRSYIDHKLKGIVCEGLNMSNWRLAQQHMLIVSCGSTIFSLQFCHNLWDMGSGTKNVNCVTATSLCTKRKGRRSQEKSVAHFLETWLTPSWDRFKI